MISVFKLFLFCLISLSCLKAQTDADILLQKIQDKFDTVKDLTADFKQSSNGRVSLKGKIYFKKESNLRIELENSVLISDGESSWNYNRKENKVIITSNDEGTNYISIQKIVYDYPGMCKLSIENVDGNDVLVLIPESSELKFSSAKLFVNKNNMIFRAAIDDPAVGLIQLDFSNIIINNNLPDSDFSFTPPEGSDVIDFR